LSHQLCLSERLRFCQPAYSSLRPSLRLCQADEAILESQQASVQVHTPYLISQHPTCEETPARGNI
jgi:hypothetical protein